MSIRPQLMLVFALAACSGAPANRPTATTMPATSKPVAAASAVKPSRIDDDANIAIHSASLAGVAEDADTTPADLAAESTYRLPDGFSAHTNRLWLEQRFGTANVAPADVPGAEGDTSHGIVLFPDDPKRRAYLYFRDEQRLRDLSMVRIIDAPSRWQLDNGITIGTPLSALVALNGKPITFTGFDWDYGGVVNNWNHGRLQAMADGRVGREIRLDHHDGGYPIGEDTYASDDHRYPRLGDTVMVGEISVSFAPDR